MQEKGEVQWQDTQMSLTDPSKRKAASSKEHRLRTESAGGGCLGSICLSPSGLALSDSLGTWWPRAIPLSRVCEGRLGCGAGRFSEKAEVRTEVGTGRGNDCLTQEREVL